MKELQPLQANRVLAHELHQVALVALRAGVSLHTVISTFIHIAEGMQQALPYCDAAKDSERAP